MITKIDADRDDARAKALKDFVKAATKKNPGAVFTYDSKAYAVPCIRTGALSLDFALGIGGVPRGRIIEIYGPESSGKCLTKDALVPTNWGLLTIEEIFERCGQKASCTSRETGVSHLDLKVINEHGELEAVSALTHNNRRPVLRIQTETGKHVTCTTNHPVRVLNERGMVVWKNAGNLVLGDVMIGVHAADPLAKDRVSTDEALLLGYLVGDGYYAHPNNFMFSQVDRQVTAEFADLVTAEFPEVKFKVYDHKPNDTWVYGKAFRTALSERYGLGQHLSPLKEIPLVVRQSGAAVQAAFLSAYFECDGWVEPQSINAVTASETLGHQIQAMLTGLGLVCTNHPKFAPEYPDRVYWTITITAGSVALFHEKIGFRSNRRAELVAKTARPAKRGPLGRDLFTGLPNMRTLLTDIRDAIGGDREFSNLLDDVVRVWAQPNHEPIRCTPARIQQVLDWAALRGGHDHPLVAHLRSLLAKPYTYERVVLIEDGGTEPTFDVVIPGTHSFVANGLAVHNTSLALSICGQAIKAGGMVGFVDVEHALEPKHMESMGVDRAYVAIAQPGSGEDALQMAESMVSSGSFAVVVVDSVAALVPQSELDGEMADFSVGTQARLMSKALRKLTGPCAKTGTTLIFINQLRMKIGVQFGSPETTSGGNALKFYASVRLDVRSPAGQYLKDPNDSKKNIGLGTNVKVVKNKVAPPHQKAYYRMVWGHGIDFAASVFEVALELGILTASSGFVYTASSTGIVLGRGKDTAMDYLSANPILADEIAEECYALLLADTVEMPEDGEPDELDADITGDLSELHDGDVDLDSPVDYAVA